RRTASAIRSRRERGFASAARTRDRETGRRGHAARGAPRTPPATSRRKDQARRRFYSARVAIPSRQPFSDAGIDESPHQIGGEIPCRQEDRADERAARNQEEIATDERVVHETAEARPRRHEFDGQRSAEEAADQDAVHAKEGPQRLTRGMHP